MIDKNGWLVPLDKPKIFSQTIIKAIRAIKKDNLNKISYETRNHIMNYFSKEKMESEFIKLWESI